MFKKTADLVEDGTPYTKHKHKSKFLLLFVTKTPDHEYSEIVLLLLIQDEAQASFPVIMELGLPVAQ